MCTQKLFPRIWASLTKEVTVKWKSFCINGLLNFQAGTYKEKEIPEPSIALAFS